MKKIAIVSVTATWISVAALTASFSLPSFAEDRYVTDVIYVPLRADKENQSGILKNGIPSGTKVKYLREEEDSNKNKWSLVITPDGVEGWIRSYNLISDTTAAMKLEAITSGSSDITELQKQNLTLKEELESYKTKYNTLLKETESMRANNTSDINMEQENQNLNGQFQIVQTERDVLNAENERLKKIDRYNQWVYGGGLILGGVFLSFILQLFGKSKRRSEWN
jgi:SH3 domain protein